MEDFTMGIISEKKRKIKNVGFKKQENTIEI